MQIKRRSIMVLTFLSLFYMGMAQQGENKIWFRQPAVDWNEALPVGNGRFGGMVFGDPRHETIQINEGSLWAGEPKNDNNPLSLKFLDSVRTLLFNNKNEEAADLANRTMLATPPTLRSYQSFMNLGINYSAGGTISDYRRDLDLTSGISTTTFTNGLNSIKQEVFVSVPDNIMVVRISATQGLLNCEFQLSRQQDAVITAKNNRLILDGQVRDTANERNGAGGNHTRFYGLVDVRAEGGQLSAVGNSIQLKNAKAVTLLINGTTNYDAEKLAINPAINIKANCEKTLQLALKQSYTLLKQNHVRQHSAQMNRVSFVLNNSDRSNQPTDERIRAVKEGAFDPGLITLYFQYGRYLLLGSSQSPGVLPANLQGIWCKDMKAPWESDFHTNINLQMNYWPAEVCNISETTLPLIHFLDKIRPNGRTTAKQMYGANGWTLHHNTSAFGETALHDAHSIRHASTGRCMDVPAFVGALFVYTGQKLFAPNGLPYYERVGGICERLPGERSGRLPGFCAILFSRKCIHPSRNGKAYTNHLFIHDGY